MKVHSTRSINFTKRAKVITELANAFRIIYPKATFTEMGEYLGISRSGAHRYFYGLNHGSNIQNMRRGASVDINLNEKKAKKLLSDIKNLKQKYDF